MLFKKIESDVSDVLREYLSLENRPYCSLDVIEKIDSLDAIEILCGLEDKFNIRIPNEDLNEVFGKDIYGLNSFEVKSIIDYIATKCN